VNYTQLLTDLEELTGQLGIQLRYEKGDFDGGYCIMKEQKMLVVNKRLQDGRKAAVLAYALSEFGLEAVFVKPAVRKYIEDELARNKKKK
jgi:hypothetical protein